MIAASAKIRLLLEQALWFKRNGNRPALKASVAAAYRVAERKARADLELRRART